MMKFKLKDEDVFPARVFEESVIKSVKPRNWWTLIHSRESKLKEPKLPKGFSEYLSKLHSCPASSGAIERIFSTFGLVWSTVRNRLGTDKAHKLVQIYRHYSLIENN